MRFTAFDLLIRSDLELPELLPCTGRASETPDVVLRVDAADAPGGRRTGPFTRIGGDWFSLEVPGIARYLVERGAQVSIDPSPGADAAAVRLFLLGPVISALLAQRGLTVLRGAAVRVGEQCMVCAGASGGGKSTVAAALMLRGHQVLADDVVAVDGQGRVLPGLARLKLWADAARALGIDTAALSPVRPGMERFSLPLGASLAERALPVRSVYALAGIEGATALRVQAVRGMQRFGMLKALAYQPGLMEYFVREDRALLHTGGLGARVGIASVERPARGMDVNVLAEYLLDDMESQA
ncbi:hypothetical protein [Pigmentiphaga humi]|uniref:hypothetical protein n=1 Tax=Pigmentiphaga humi TaxID=2478468 RepID=UPI000F548878|nr:hypothetical protein [Pigmentiphaga humi]